MGMHTCTFVVCSCCSLPWRDQQLNLISKILLSASFGQNSIDLIGSILKIPVYIVVHFTNFHFTFFLFFFVSSVARREAP